MSEAIKNVAVVGAGGTIGRPIVSALLASNLFTVTILTRDGNSSALRDAFPQDKLAIKQVDYTSIPSLTSALVGIDAVVSAMSFSAIQSQSTVVDAAAQVGVKRFIASEYGNDTLDPRLQDIPIYVPKIAIRKQCEERSKESGGRFTWTTIQNASFLAPDWTLDFVVDVRNRKCDVKDGGDVLFTATTYQDIATAIVGVLSHPAETANRPVKISSVDTTQNEIIQIAKELIGGNGGQWDIKHSSCEEDIVESRRRWAEGDRSEEVVALFINWAFIGVRCGYFPESIRDNGLLGVSGVGKEGLKKIIQERLQMSQ